MATKLTLVEFLAKSVAAHGVGCYDYSKAVYESNKNKVEIICFEHGAFKQVPDSHIRGRGCPKCRYVKSANTNRSNTESFIGRAQAAHGVGTYDYSQVVYKGKEQEVRITCPIHGVFEQRAGAHLTGQGCQKCGVIRRANTHRSNTESFIGRAQAAHGVGTYDYSQVVYTSYDKTIKITCPIHGVFEQVARTHLQGNGCAHCSGKARLTLSRFIGRAQAAHGVGTYDYSQVVYTNTTTKIKIICPIHGVFEQRAGDHFRGRGCQKCGLELLLASASTPWINQANGRLATLYFVRIFNSTESFYKVGVTFLPIKKRFCRRMLPCYQYEVVALHTSSSPARVRDWEESILETFSHLRYKPSLSFSGETECFGSADEILAIFPL